jgi:dCTP deaminase
MTVLCDWEISGLSRLYGMVQPFQEELVNPASIDVLLGKNLLTEVDAGEFKPVDLSPFSKEKPFLLEPSAFCLAQTQETFNLPDDIAAKFALKSSRAREGYNHMLAGWCDPGWHGSVLTLELTNAKRFSSLPLYPGLKIGQMVFYRMSAKPRANYAETGHYNNHSKVMGSVA